MPDCRSANSMIVANSIVVPKPAKNGSAIRQPWNLLVHGLGLVHRNEDDGHLRKLLVRLGRE